MKHLRERCNHYADDDDQCAETSKDSEHIAGESVCLVLDDESTYFNWNDLVQREYSFLNPLQREITTDYMGNKTIAQISREN